MRYTVSRNDRLSGVFEKDGQEITETGYRGGKKTPTDAALSAAKYK
jgi:general stress protein YciG